MQQSTLKQANYTHIIKVCYFFFLLIIQYFTILENMIVMHLRTLLHPQVKINKILFDPLRWDFFLEICALDGLPHVLPYRWGNHKFRLIYKERLMFEPSRAVQYLSNFCSMLLIYLVFLFEDLRCGLHLQKYIFLKNK